MYELLAIAYEINKRDPEHTKTALGWAGYLAKQRKEPVSLIRVADMFMLRNMDAVQLADKRRAGSLVRVGDLLDLAMSEAPHLDEPIWLSIQLAKRQRDPVRLGDALERLLSLGWPGTDEAVRLEAKRQLDQMTDALSSSGRIDDAAALRSRWPELSARDLVVKLTWEGDARLDLVVEEPLGAKADHFNPRTVFGGALVSEARGSKREAVYVCPRAFDGAYQIRVEVLYNDDKKPVAAAKVEVTTHEGAPGEKREAHTVSLASLKPGPVQVTLEGGRRKQVLPYQAPAPEVVITPPGEAGSEDSAVKGSAGAKSAAKDSGIPGARSGATESTKPRR
jgi:hypothetical protein